jgi:hypothetical protein
MQFYSFQNTISVAQKNAIMALYQLVFNVENTNKFFQRVENERNILFLLAYQDQELEDLKLGMKKIKKCFTVGWAL